MMNPLSVFTPLLNSPVAEGIVMQTDIPASEILLKCRQVQSHEDLEKFFLSLLEIISCLTWEQFKWDFLDSCLPYLQTHASPMQLCSLNYRIALRFSERGDRENSLSSSDQLFFSLEAMHYFAKAFKAAQDCNDHNLTKSIHKSASQMFMTFIMQQCIVKDDFRKSLVEFTKYEDRNAFEIFETLANRVNLLKTFCCEEKDNDLISFLYKEAFDVIANVQPEFKEKYNSCEQTLITGYKKPFIIPNKYVTERYREVIAAFRKSFEIIPKNKVRDLQFNTAKAFIEIFQQLIDDAFAILGPPPATFSYNKKTMKYEYNRPCTFDIRAMGSLGCGEASPYSKLDLIILIKDKKAISYFETLVNILKIQIASLGESFSFNVRLILPPDMMAQLQNNAVNEPQAIENIILKTKSLYASDAQLFESYQSALHKTLKNCRKERALKFFTIRCENYKKNWPKPFNPKTDLVDIKKQFIEPINYLLGDIAFYYDLPDTNTLDIINALVEDRKLFTEESGFLLKECVFEIYKLRIALQTHYEAPCEEASCADHPHFATLTYKEVQALEKCYLLVLSPLYCSLERALKSPFQDFEVNFQNIDLLRETIT